MRVCMAMSGTSSCIPRLLLECDFIWEMKERGGQKKKKRYVPDLACESPTSPEVGGFYAPSIHPTNLDVLPMGLLNGKLCPQEEPDYDAHGWEQVQQDSAAQLWTALLPRVAECHCCIAKPHDRCAQKACW